MQNEPKLETVLGCILGKGVGWRSLWDFSLCSLSFWKAKLSGVGRVKSLSHPFNSNLNFPYSLVFSLDVWGSNLLPDNSLMKLFLNLTVYWVTCLVFQKWGFLRLCFQPTRQDAEGLETRLIQEDSHLSVKDQKELWTHQDTHGFNVFRITWITDQVTSM